MTSTILLSGGIVLYAVKDFVPENMANSGRKNTVAGRIISLQNHSVTDVIYEQ